MTQPIINPDDPSLFAKILYWLAAIIITVACAYFIIVLSWAAFWLITLFVPWWVMAGIIGISIIGYAGAIAFLHAVGDH